MEKVGGIRGKFHRLFPSLRTDVTQRGKYSPSSSPSTSPLNISHIILWSQFKHQLLRIKMFETHLLRAAKLAHRTWKAMRNEPRRYFGGFRVCAYEAGCGLVALRVQTFLYLYYLQTLSGTHLLILFPFLLFHTNMTFTTLHFHGWRDHIYFSYLSEGGNMQWKFVKWLIWLELLCLRPLMI